MSWVWWEWPCHTARMRLRAEFDGAPVSLALYLGAQFARAAYDLCDVPAGALHARFLGWTRTTDEPGRR